ncbi:MAG: transposase [Bacilli bacterium]|nr:transposase [Bacilli bacterium]
MGVNTDGLIKYAKVKKEKTLEKVNEAIRSLSLKGESINFNSVSKVSGVSKNFLYSNEEVKNRIQELRSKQINTEINQRAKYEKNSKSKDIIIASKNKRIEKLEAENAKLRLQLELLQSKIYNEF